MKTMALKITLSTLLLLVSGIAQSSINLGFSPVTQSGNTVNVGIVISGLGSGIAPSLGAYDFDISFDPNYLAYTDTVFGDTFLGKQLDLMNEGSITGSATAGTDLSNRPNLINLFELSLDTVEDLNNLQADTFTLATLSFTALQHGTSQLAINLNALGDSEGGALVAELSSTTVTTVPLPSAFFMMLTGLFGFIAARSRISVER